MTFSYYSLKAARLDECLSSPCGGENYRCVDEECNYSCVCAGGFIGPKCDPSKLFLHYLYTIIVWMKIVATVVYVMKDSLDPTVILVSYFYTTYTLSLCG